VSSQFTDAECAILRAMIAEHHASSIPSPTGPSDCLPDSTTSQSTALVSFADILKNAKCSLGVVYGSLAVVKNDGTAAWRIVIIPDALDSTRCTVVLLSLDDEKEVTCSTYPQCSFADGDLTRLIYTASAVHALSKTCDIAHTFDTFVHRHGGVVTPTAYGYIRRYIK